MQIHKLLTLDTDVFWGCFGVASFLRGILLWGVNELVVSESLRFYKIILLFQTSVYIS